MGSIEGGSGNDLLKTTKSGGWLNMKSVSYLYLRFMSDLSVFGVALTNATGCGSGQRCTRIH